MTTASPAPRIIRGLPSLPEDCRYWVCEDTSGTMESPYVMVGIEGPDGTIATGSADGILTDRRVVKAAKRAYRQLSVRLAEANRKERYAHGIAAPAE